MLQSVAYEAGNILVDPDRMLPNLPQQIKGRRHDIVGRVPASHYLDQGDQVRRIPEMGPHDPSPDLRLLSDLRNAHDRGVGCKDRLFGA